MHLVRELLLAIKDDIAKVAEERMPEKDLDLTVWQNWQPLLQACWSVYQSAPSPIVSRACIKVTRLLLVDIHAFKPLNPAPESLEPVRAWLASLAKALLEDVKGHDVEYHRSSWKLLTGVLLGRSVTSFAPLIEQMVTAFLPRLARRSVARVISFLNFISCD